MPIDYATGSGTTDTTAVGGPLNTYVEAAMLKHATSRQLAGRFVMQRKLPKNKTDNATYRRVKPLPPVNDAPLTEGVPPSPRKMEYESVNIALQQYGDRVKITDQVEDFETDDVANDAYMLCGEQARDTKELICWGAMIGGTNVYFSNGAARADVNAVFTRTMQRKVTRGLKNERAQKITKIQDSSPNYRTEPVDAAYVALCHTNCESDIRNADGFVPVEQYAGIKALPDEIGKIEDVRYFASALLNPFVGAGSATVTGVENDGAGTPKVNVYPIIYLGEEAVIELALKGQGAITPKVVPTGTLTTSNPLGQEGSIGWIAYFAAKIANQQWIARLEVAISQL